MRIGIDAKFLTHPQKGGFKTYTEKLIQSLAKLDRKNEYILYLDRQSSPDANLPQYPNFSYRIVPNRYSFLGMPWREQVGLSRQIYRDRLDLFHAPCLTAPLLINIPLVVTIHDTIWLYPNRYANNQAKFGKRKFMEWYYRYVPEIAVRKAKGIITVSNAAKKNIINYLNVHADRIHVTHEAANEMYRPIENDDAAVSGLEKYGLRSNYILGIGSADPRKNINALIEAYSMLPVSIREIYRLAIVWNHNLLASELSLKVNSLGITGQVLFLENVDDHDLLTLYNHATIFVFPSLEEGFGLPPLEAMACGTPVLAANNSSLPEIVGDAAILFSFEKKEELMSLLIRVLNDPDLQERMKTCGLERAAKFSWNDCALKTIEIYNKIIHNQT